MIGPVLQTDARVAQAGSATFKRLPGSVQLGLLVAALLVGMGGCTAAWIDQQDYVPAPNVCAPGQEFRTDCVQVRRVMPTPGEQR